jgi:thiazole synthase
VTVALRRVDLDKNPEGDPLISKLDPEKVVIVPNTSGARTAEEAIRIARLARAAGGFDWIKLELTPNLHHLLPDPIETLKAAEALVKEGSRCAVYQRRPVLPAPRGGRPAAVMPLAATIGTNSACAPAT